MATRKAVEAQVRQYVVTFELEGETKSRGFKSITKAAEFLATTEGVEFLYADLRQDASDFVTAKLDEITA